VEHIDSGGTFWQCALMGSELDRTVLDTGRGESKIAASHWRLGTQATEFRLDPSKIKRKFINETNILSALQPNLTA